jgi:AbrB family looped-hinge helix DNA binding protein
VGRQFVWYKSGVAHIKESSHTDDRAVVAIGERGRLVLPARIRRSLGLRAGDHLLAEVQPDHSLRLVPRDVAARRDRGAFARLRTESSLVDELIADRREEAAREDR